MKVGHRDKENKLQLELSLARRLGLVRETMSKVLKAVKGTLAVLALQYGNDDTSEAKGGEGEKGAKTEGV
jgi:hypothetical protein